MIKKKKSKPTNWGKWYRSEEDYKAMAWCVKNDIKIGPLAVSPGAGPTHFFIEIIIEGRVNRGPYKWEAKDVWPEIYKYYKYYYDKHRK
jgi:hypothetical protein|tara:strand:+ start:522 stop:788 length:267 start_codon:yes stop_codon:yes gene_type:complete